jgi:DNA polymerase III subunit beta
MKFECKGEVFIKAVQQVSRARSKTQSQNYLQDIHIELDTHLLTLRATNLELFCEKSIPVKGMVNGNCLLQGETLLRIISTFQSKDMTLQCEIQDGVFTITTEKGLIEIKTTPYEDFPKLPQQGTVLGTLSKESLVMLLRDVSFCSAATEIKPEISSLYLYTKNDFMYAVATDSYRLAERAIPNERGLDFSVLLPQKHISEIIQIINEEEGDLTLSKNGNIFSVASHNLTLSIHTITGHFPDYQQLFPKEFTTTITLSKEELQKALTLTTFFNEQYSQVECIFTDSKCTLHSKNETVGQVTHTISAKKEGEDIEAKYNNKYFLEVFPHIEGDTITCMFTTAMRPMFIRGTQDITFTYLLMPLNR